MGVRTRTGRTVAIWILAAAFGYLIPPVDNAVAQNVIEHQSLHGSVVDIDGPQRSPMPLVSPQRVPLSLLLRPQARPVATASGATTGSASGTAAQAGSGVAATKVNAFGTQSILSVAPYTAARASAAQLGTAPTIAAAVGVTSYPLRASGKLYFKIAGVAYVCTASLIKPGILITAAHCVFEFGKGATGWHTDFVFAPAQYANGQSPPYGVWTATSEIVPASYRNGTDTCYLTSIVCNNDVALIVMARSAKGALPGTIVGWYGYGWGGYSAVLSFGGALLSSVTQLGYPVAFDSGLMLERNDGVAGIWLAGSLHNTVLGSPFSGGSSGGPWLVNFGAQPTLDPLHADLGTSSLANVVIGVTSWGYAARGVNTQGASMFGANKEFPASSYKDTHNVDRGAGNIGAIVAAACSAYADHC